MADQNLSVRVELTGYTQTLATIARIYDITAEYARRDARSVRAEVATVEYGARTWADLHLEALGWSFVFGVIALVFAVALAWPS